MRQTFPSSSAKCVLLLSIVIMHVILSHMRKAGRLQKLESLWHPQEIHRFINILFLPNLWAFARVLALGCDVQNCSNLCKTDNIKSYSSLHKVSFLSIVLFHRSMRQSLITGSVARQLSFHTNSSMEMNCLSEIYSQYATQWCESMPLLLLEVYLYSSNTCDHLSWHHWHFR